MGTPKKMTDRSAKWVATVLENCRAKTGRSTDEWVQLARKANLGDARAARAWGKKQGLSIVYANMVTQELFPADESDDALVDKQYSGAKAEMRPVYDALATAARRLGGDVEVMPRSSQVTFSRKKSFAVVRAATRDRIDLLLKLPGTAATARLAANRGAGASDPSHVVSLRAPKDVDRELVGWLRAAYERAG
jgi:hypothetical protein